MEVTRATKSSQRRFAQFAARMTTARTERHRRHALVWWWLAEVKRLPAHLYSVEFARLRDIASRLNGGDHRDGA